MSEPNGAAFVVSTVSAVLMAVFGVDYYSLLWATVGAAATLLYSKPQTKTRAAWAVGISSLLGAALGTFIAARMFNGERSALIVCALVCATGPYMIINALLTRFVAVINRGLPADEPIIPKEDPPQGS